jgi:AraC family transcriptional activator of pobA
MQKQRVSIHEHHTVDAGPFRIEVHRLSPGNKQIRMGPHGHSSPGLLYLERGRGTCYSEGRQWEMTAGDLYLASSGEMHDLSGLAEAEGWGILFPMEALGQAREDGALRLWRGNPLLSLFVQPGGKHVSHLRLPDTDHPRWSGRCAAMEEELRTRRVGYQQVVQAYLTLLLVDTARLAMDVVGTLRLQEEFLLAKIFHVIEERYTEPVSLRDVAIAVGFSPTYLTTHLRERTGRTVGEWLVEYRMGEARRLLAETDTSVETISLLVGYHDPAYFTRLFRRIHGTTPLRWRRTNRDT